MGIAMQIVKKVLVKQVITEASKETLQQAFRKEMIQLDRECQQLLFEQRKLKNKVTSSKREITERFEEEIKQRKDKMTLIEFKLNQLDLLEIGSEIVEKEVDALVDLAIGSDWNELMNKQAIVVEDGIVVRIDQG